MTAAAEPVRLAPAEIELYRSHIGRTETAEQVLDVESLRRFAAAIGADPSSVALRMPPLGHWAYFLPVATADRLGADGHPLRGGFLPPVRLARRMFAGARLRFLEPIEPGAPASLASTVADVKHRSGSSGDLIFVDVERVLSQSGRPRIEERQTIVYTNPAGRIPPVAALAEPPVPEDSLAVRHWTPGEVDLFRFSAVTFNAHRIHYDRRYASEVELYPDLVVHGPFTAAMLCGLASELLDGPVGTFEFRAVAPIFVGPPVTLVARRAGEGLALQALRCDGAVAMTATAGS
ncbi:MAG TPA: MaoC family dehydratase N-terminal domain-containing protein [Stellaceae bacterium]|nr:MaoC family dehydratase N-terminal domain-containing protein [Stellaceae bacterium]